MVWQLAVFQLCKTLGGGWQTAVIATTLGPGGKVTPHVSGKAVRIIHRLTKLNLFAGARHHGEAINPDGIPL